MIFLKTENRCKYLDNNAFIDFVRKIICGFNDYYEKKIDFFWLLK